MTRPQRIRCDACGGDLREVWSRQFDFSPFAGLPVTLGSPVPVYRCSSCGAESADGRVIELVLHNLALAITKRERILDPRSARYLRRYLGLTQQALAERIGIDRVTIANWEGGTKPISPQHDFILRVLALEHLQATLKRAVDDARRSGITLRAEDPALPASVRQAEARPPEPPPAFVIDALQRRPRASKAKAPRKT